MTENMRGEGKRERTPEEIFEATLNYGFANYPLTPMEIERMIKNLKEEEISPDVPSVIRKVLEEKTNHQGDLREIESLVTFCEQHNISLDIRELDEIEQRWGGFMDSGRLRDSLQRMRIAKLKKHFKPD